MSNFSVTLILNKILKNIQQIINSLFYRSLKRLHPLYRNTIKSKQRFLELGGKIDEVVLELDDIQDFAGSAGGHYFHQDLLVAKFIFDRNPQKHLDIGSRIDGFVAHVASFRKISVLDIREITLNAHPNIEFIKGDFLRFETGDDFDSISCLHTIEHIGLGRYGDSIDPEGSKKTFHKLLSLLSAGGRLYLSFPIGHESRVIFNRHRIFSPRIIFDWILESPDTKLERFDYVDDLGNLIVDQDVDLVSELNLKYGCGIYTLVKDKI